MGAPHLQAPAARVARFARVLRACLYAVIGLAGIVVVDNLLAHFLTDYKLNNLDWALAGFAGGFLLLAWLRRRAAEKLAVSLLAVFVTLMILEIGLTIVSRVSNPRSFDWYGMPPNLRFELTPTMIQGVAHESTFSTNSTGIRGPEFSDDDRIRILCVGGSTTECLFLNDAKSWPALVAGRMNETSPGVWVGNSGRSGTIVEDHYTLVRYLPEAAQVDCWLVMCGINDLGLTLQGKLQDRMDHTFETAFTYRRPGISLSPQFPLQRNLYTYQMCSGMWKKLRVMLDQMHRTVVQDPSAAWVKHYQEEAELATKETVMPDVSAGLLAYEGSLKKLLERGRELDIKVIFMTQPTIWTEHPSPETQALMIGLGAKESYIYSMAVSARLMQAYNDQLLAFCRREGVPCIDLAAMVPKTIENFYDDCHYTEKGAEVVAEVVANAMQAYMDRVAEIGAKRREVKK
ncbi:MAG: SGNH/GDSL hydrolase family protein [Phycisphaeraceae bacterium]